MPISRGFRRVGRPSHFHLCDLTENMNIPSESSAPSVTAPSMSIEDRIGRTATPLPASDVDRRIGDMMSSLADFKRETHEKVVATTRETFKTIASRNAIKSSQNKIVSAFHGKQDRVIIKYYVAIEWSVRAANSGYHFAQSAIALCDAIKGQKEFSKRDIDIHIEKMKGIAQDAEYEARAVVNFLRTLRTELIAINSKTTQLIQKLEGMVEAYLAKSKQGPKWASISEAIACVATGASCIAAIASTAIFGVIFPPVLLAIPIILPVIAMGAGIAKVVASHQIARAPARAEECRDDIARLGTSQALGLAVQDNTTQLIDRWADIHRDLETICRDVYTEGSDIPNILLASLKQRWEEIQGSYVLYQRQITELQDGHQESKSPHVMKKCDNLTKKILGKRTTGDQESFAVPTAVRSIHRAPTFLSSQSLTAGLNIAGISADRSLANGSSTISDKAKGRFSELAPSCLHTTMEEPRTMEIFVRNIPYSVDEIQLTRALATILHGPSFETYMGGAPFNFLVRLIKSKKYRQNKHSGCAIVLVPTWDIGSQLIRISNSYPHISIQGRRIFCDIGREQNPAREDVAALAEPYQDPVILEEEQNRRAELAATGIKADWVAFGWPCHDNSVSLEWQSRIECSWSLSFETNPIRLKLQSTDNIYIWLYLRAIQSIALVGDTCFISLERPPVFESGPTDLAAVVAAVFLDNNKPLRERIVSPDMHSVGLIGLLRVMCVKFQEFTSRKEFQRRAQMIGRSIFQGTDRIERKGLLSEETMHAYTTWIAMLPYEVAFQIEGLVTRRHFNPKELLGIRQEIESAIEQHGEATVASCVQHLQNAREEEQEAPVIRLFLELVDDCSSGRRPFRHLPRDTEVFECHNIVITPTSIILNGPFPDETNRVIRKYRDHQQSFLRVQFREEDLLQLRQEREISSSKILDERFRRYLHKGITVAGRKFEFLGYSSSALKDHAVWFMTPFKMGETMMTPDFIRDSLGDFSTVIYCPARYGARIAQAFSATEDGTLEEPDHIIYEEDKKSPQGLDYTDGVGRMSEEMAEEIWSHYTESRSKRSRRRLQTPSAFQIRLGGAKGMLCVDTRLQGRVLTIRESMNKFQSNDRQVEISRAFDRPMPMYLNRYLIMLLETLGIDREPFMDLQRVAVQDTKRAAKCIESAAHLLEKYGLGTSYKMTSVMLHLHKLGVDLHSRESDNMVVPFLRRMMEFAVNHVLRDIKFKARIPVPKAWTLVGVADEWDYLAENEIFAYVCATNGKKEYINGPVLISRSPTVHPGDARMVWAIGEPPWDAPDGLRALTNCVVFPCAGDRPLPDMLAGGDLDGDIFCLIQDERLHPNVESLPGDYDRPKLVELDRPSTGRDVADFVIDYIKNDILGIIANQLLLTADIQPQCMADPDCLALANLHSQAVDFPKSGRPVDAGSLPRIRSTRKPDWYANEISDNNAVKFYTSSRIIGHLFRDIELPAPPKAGKLGRRQRRRIAQDEMQSLQVHRVYRYIEDDRNVISRLVRRRLEDYVDIQTFEESNITPLIEEMFDIYEFYWGVLGYICDTHSLSRSTPLSEEEIVASTIAQRCSQPRMRQELTAAIRRDSSSICETTREGIEGAEDISEEDRLLRAWIAWKVSVAYQHAYASTSFGLLSLEVIFKTMREIDSS
ncbi:hypothetical protein FRC17_000903 [Serendipita sp. 399]|nr:hypothetical protein FRC17_000903 [Serendipita sp. 399]